MLISLVFHKAPCFPLACLVRWEVVCSVQSSFVWCVPVRVRAFILPIGTAQVGHNKIVVKGKNRKENMQCVHSPFELKYAC